MKPAIAVLFFLAFLSVSTVTAADYYVSTAGSDNGPGTQELPFASIQHAIDACPYDVLSSTVHIDGSVWFESPVLVAFADYSAPPPYPYPHIPDRRRLTVIGDFNGPNGMGGAGKSIINGNFTINAFSSSGPVLTNAIATLKGVSIISCMAKTYDMASAATPSKILIEDCTINNSPRHGIEILSNFSYPGFFAGIQITDCVIKNCQGDGIHVNPYAFDPYIENSLISNNTRAGFKTFASPAFGAPSHLTGNQICSNDTGISIYNSANCKLVISNNTIKNNKCGVYISNTNPDLGGGALGSTGGNTISGNGTYDLYKTGTNNVYAKYNHWDTATEAQMAAGFQKKTNITRFYDAFDYWQPGNPLSGAFIWSSGFPKNGKLEFTAKNKSHVQPASLGKLKAAYAR